jgi:predicted MFS family arabinose efflux permease
MRRDYALLLSATFISLTGDWILTAGLAYQVYVLTGSTLASAAMVLAALLPQVALGSCAGVLADRWDRRRTMIVANLLLAATLLPLLLVNHPRQTPIVYAVMTVQSAIAVFFSAAEAALLPVLVPASRRVTANALNGQIRDVGRLSGAALGGVLAGLGGIRLITIADALTFVAAAGMLTLIRFRAARTPVAVSRRHVLREWLAGARIAVSQRALRTLLVFVLITGVGEAVMSALMAPFVRDVLHGGATAYGNIMAVQAVGGLAGGLVVTLVAHRIPPRVLLGGGALAFGLLDLLLFLYPLVFEALWPALVIMVLVGLPGAANLAGLMTIFQTATEDRHRGRVFGAITAVHASAMLIGIGLAGTAGGGAGIVPIIAIQGFGYCAAGAFALVALPKAPVQRDDDRERVASSTSTVEV